MSSLSSPDLAVAVDCSAVDLSVDVDRSAVDVDCFAVLPVLKSLFQNFINVKGGISSHAAAVM